MCALEYNVELSSIASSVLDKGRSTSSIRAENRASELSPKSTWVEICADVNREGGCKWQLKSYYCRLRQSGSMVRGSNGFFVELTLGIQFAHIQTCWTKGVNIRALCLNQCHRLTEDYNLDPRYQRKRDHRSRQAWGDVRR